MSANIWSPDGEVLVSADNSVVVQHFTITDPAQAVFVITAFSYTPMTNSVSVYINGVYQRSGIDYLESSKASITFISHTFVYGDSVSIAGNTDINQFPQSDWATQKEVHIATAGQTTFTLLISLVESSAMRVFINGLLEDEGDSYSYGAGNTVIFSEGLQLNDEVTFMVNYEVGHTRDADEIQFLQAGTGAVTRTAQDKMRESVSVLDFGAIGDGVTDNAAAINAAFSAATLLGKPVHIPRGVYLVNSPLLFGTQSLVSQSSHPTGIYGDGWQSILKAGGSLTGTVLQAWSTAGVTFENFAVDASLVSDTGIDTSWEAGVGPSVQNKYNHVRISDATGTGWSAVDNNDCVFDHIVVNMPSHDLCAIDLTASGGLVYMDHCVWNGGYLLLGIQSGSINTSWGHGILFASGCTNYIKIDGCYMYANTYLDACFKSASFSSFQSIKALTCIATQFITAVETVSSYFDLNAYSTLDFQGCQWIGATNTMFGSNCRADASTNVQSLFRGGSSNGNTLLNVPSGFSVTAEGLVVDGPYPGTSLAAGNTAGKNYNINVYGTFVPTIGGAGGTGTTTYSEQSGIFYRVGNRISFELRVAWSTTTASGQLRVYGLPGDQVGNGSASISYVNSVLGGVAVNMVVSGNYITFFTTSGIAIDAGANGDLLITGNYQVVA